MIGRAAVQQLVCSNCGGSDTASLVAALASVFVALVTLGVVIATFKSANATKRSAEATERSASVEEKEAQATLEQAHASQALVTLTQQQMSAAVTPIVIPVADSTRTVTLPNFASTLDLTPRTIEGRVFLVPVVNVGTGPALGVGAVVTRLDGPEPVKPRQNGARVAALAAGADVFMRLRIAVADTIRGRFGLTLEYNDVLGSRYEVTAHYEPTSQSYPLIEVAMFDKDGNPVRSIAAGGPEDFQW